MKNPVLFLLLAFTIGEVCGVDDTDKIQCYFCSELPARMARSGHQGGSSIVQRDLADGSSASSSSGGAVIFPSGNSGMRLETVSPTPSTDTCQEPEDVDDEELAQNPQLFGELQEVDVNTEGCYVLHADNSPDGDITERDFALNSKLQKLFNDTDDGCYYDVMKNGQKHFGCICRTDKCNRNSAPAKSALGILSLMCAAMVVAVVGGSRGPKSLA